MSDRASAGTVWRRCIQCPADEVSDTGRVRRVAPGHGATVGRELRTPIDAGGYPTVHVCGRPRRVHVLVAEAFHGRRLPPGAQVHHRDENRGNPRLSNLRICLSHRSHQEEHRTRLDLRRDGEPNPTLECACGCGRTFPKYDDLGRPRRYVSGHNLRSGRKEVVGSRG